MSAPMAGRRGRGEAAHLTHIAWVHALMGMGLGLFVLLAAFRSTSVELVSIWRTSATYDYAWGRSFQRLAYLLCTSRRFSACNPTRSLVALRGGVCVYVARRDLANLAWVAKCVYRPIRPRAFRCGWRVFRGWPFLSF